MSDEGLIRLALKRALHSVQGATERWALRRATGLTDDELSAALLEWEWSCSPGFWGWDFGYQTRARQGAVSIQIYGPYDPTREDRHATIATLTGRRLLAAVRQVTGVGQKAQAGQLALFNLQENAR